ncbi:MAG TPA: hypothetical protein VHD88_03195 [Pyrinomonadaceae bacterium]|nr:hypothetical protein [Pyrinomonadaceae bacterium]
MIIATLRTWFEAIRALLTNAKSLAIFAGLYALLLATLYGFIATREATVWQVAITLLGLVLLPAEFFIFQAAIVDRARDSRFRWRAILIDACKLFVVTIPTLIIAYVLWLLLNKWQVHFPAPKAAIAFPPAPLKPQPVHWPTLLFATLRCLLFGIALPLATIHLWIEVASHDLKTLFVGGAKAILKRIGCVFARAFSSNSVLTYALGLIIFVAIPYALLFIPITIKGNKTEFAVFILRLVLVFAFTLFGWIVTVGALARLPRENTPAVDSPSEAKPLELSEEPTG